MTHKSFNNPLKNNTLVGRTQIAEPVGEQLMQLGISSHFIYSYINFFKLVVFPNKWKLQNPSLPLFPPCQASSCDPSSPSDGSPCACSQGPWPLPFSCSSPGTREETCNDSRQIQKRFQKEYTSCETAKHENVPNVTTFLPKLVDSNYTYQKRHEFQVSNKNLGASSHNASHTTMNMEVSSQCQFWSLEILPPNQLFAKIKHISSCLLWVYCFCKRITLRLRSLQLWQNTFIKVLAVFGFRSNSVSDSACRILHLQSTKKWIPPCSSSPISSLLRQSPATGHLFGWFFLRPWNLRGVKEAGNPPKTKGGESIVGFFGVSCLHKLKSPEFFSPAQVNPEWRFSHRRVGIHPWRWTDLQKNMALLETPWQGWTIIQRFILLLFIGDTYWMAW